MADLPPILFLHGLATSGSRTWGDNGWIDLVGEAKRESLVIDLPGHGENYTQSEYATFEKSILFVEKNIHTAPIDGIGFSLGARMLLTIASRQPKVFRKLVLSGVGKNLFSSDSQRYKSIRKGISGTPDPDDPESRYFHQLAESSDINRVALKALISSPMPQIEKESIAKIECPVLVVLGENDFAQPATELVEALPDATYLELKRVDHFSTPKNFTFIESALRFLNAEPKW